MNIDTEKNELEKIVELEVRESVNQVEESVNQVEELVNQVEELVDKVDESKPVEEPKHVEEPINPIKYADIVKLIMLLLSTNEKFNELMSKAKLNLDETQSKQIKNILGFLNNESNNSRPLNMIVDEVLKVLSDNKLELHEIPKIINVIHESLKNLDSIKISTSDIGILIKLFLFILIETKTVKLSNVDYDLIANLIDSCLILLNKTVEIKLPKTNKCICF